MFGDEGDSSPQIHYLVDIFYDTFNADCTILLYLNKYYQSEQIILSIILEILSYQKSYQKR